MEVQGTAAVTQGHLSAVTGRRSLYPAGFVTVHNIHTVAAVVSRASGGGQIPAVDVRATRHVLACQAGNASHKLVEK